MKKYLYLILILLFITACVNTDYIGKSFAPTTNVDVYFSESDIDKEYEVMGKISEEATEYLPFDKLQQEMIEQAKAKGADGIILGDMEKVETGSSSYSSGSIEDKSVDKNTYSSSTSDIITKDNVLHGTLIKYSK